MAGVHAQTVCGGGNPPAVRAMEAEKEYHFNASQLEAGLASLVGLGVTRLLVRDRAITGSRDGFLGFLERALREAPDIFYKFYVEPSVVDGQLCQLLSNFHCSLQLRLDAAALSGRKSFERKIGLLNRSGLVFGFDLEFASNAADSAKLFKERLNLALSLYPNHIDFPQLEEGLPAPTQFFSSRDIALAADKSHACSLFYSEGRAVPWFLTVLKPLRISADAFFADFAEWLACNNLARGSLSAESGKGTISCQLSHQEIERMQLLFLELKYQEKALEHLLPVVQELVRFNGAFARLVGEDVEGELDLAFHPDDLESPCSQDVVAFAESVCMEHCRIRLCWMQDREGNNFPGWQFV